jgi:hypothetical protein
MGRQIVKQPNGKYAVWTTISDGFISVNDTKEELIRDLIEEEIENIKKRIPQDVNRVISALESNEKPYYQFTKSWEECLKTIREVHGEDTSPIENLCKKETNGI